MWALSGKFPFRAYAKDRTLVAPALGEVFFCDFELFGLLLGFSLQPYDCHVMDVSCSSSAVQQILPEPKPAPVPFLAFLFFL